MYNRRKILKTAGVVAGIGITGTASVSATDEKIGTAEVGINDEVSELLRKGEINEVLELLDKHDIKYAHESSRKELKYEFGNDNEDFEGSGDEVSTEGYWRQDSSEAYCTLVNSEDDVWLATGYASIRDRRTNYPWVSRVGANLPDVCAL